MDFSHEVKMAESECASCASRKSESIGSSTYSESVSRASDSEHESTTYTRSSLGHLRPPPRKKGKSKGTGKFKCSWCFLRGFKEY